MERAVQSQLVAFLIEHTLLSFYQSGFRKKHFTENATVYFVDQILQQMGKQMMTGSIFIDLKKAFDLVDHQCLLPRLEAGGFLRSPRLTTCCILLLLLLLFIFLFSFFRLL